MRTRKSKNDRDREDLGDPSGKLAVSRAHCYQALTESSDKMSMKNVGFFFFFFVVGCLLNVPATG